MQCVGSEQDTPDRKFPVEEGEGLGTTDQVVPAHDSISVSWSAPTSHGAHRHAVRLVGARHTVQVVPGRRGGGTGDDGPARPVPRLDQGLKLVPIRAAHRHALGRAAARDGRQLVALTCDVGTADDLPRHDGTGHTTPDRRAHHDQSHHGHGHGHGESCGPAAVPVRPPRGPSSDLVASRCSWHPPGRSPPALRLTAYHSSRPGNCGTPRLIPDGWPPPSLTSRHCRNGPVRRYRGRRSSHPLRHKGPRGRRTTARHRRR